MYTADRRIVKSLSSEFREETKGQAERRKLRGLHSWIAHDPEEMDQSVIRRASVREIPKILNFCEVKLKHELAVTDSLPSLSQGLEAGRQKTAVRKAREKKTDISRKQSSAQVSIMYHWHCVLLFCLNQEIQF